MAKQRFVIKHPSGTFFSHCDVDGSVDEIQVVNGAKEVVTRKLLAPKFIGGASKFDTAEDAAAMMKHPDINPSPTNQDDHFNGCTVEPADE